MKNNILFAAFLVLMLLFGLNQTFAQQWANNGTHIYNTNSGNVGIGTGTSFTPTAKLHINNGNTVAAIMCESAYTGTENHSVGNLRLKNSTTGDMFNITLRKNGTIDEMLQSSYEASAGLWREFIYYNYGTRKYEMRNGVIDAEFKNSGNLLFNMSGDVGIGTIDPSHKLEVTGDFYLNYTQTENGMYAIGSTPLALVYIQNSYAGNTWGLSAGCNSYSAGPSSIGVLGWNHGSGYGVFGRCETGTGVFGENTNSFNTGYLGGSSYGVYGYHDSSGNYGSIGGLHNGLYGYLSSSDPGDYACLGYNGIDGFTSNSYSVSYTIGGIEGYVRWGNSYTFAMAGYSWLDDGRSGSTFGSNIGGSIWGCLGYKNSGNSYYGGYFTTSTTGSGKSSEVMTHSGIGAWGDLFGADIHGKIYGIYAEGENYAMYSHGITYKDNLDVNLQENGNGTNTPLYTSTSTDVTVMTSGTATLSGGKASISFDKSFSESVSGKEPIIVTVTPMGLCSGVYLSEVNASGCTIGELNNGKSSVTVNYIAIGKRAGYEKPQLSQEVVDHAYVDKLSNGLHNDNDLQTNGQGLYYENGQLVVGIHPSTLPDPNRPRTDPFADRAISEKEKQAAKKQPTDTDRSNGAAPERVK
jgi:hypothetical protein